MKNGNNLVILGFIRLDIIIIVTWKEKVLRF